MINHFDHVIFSLDNSEKLYYVWMALNMFLLMICCYSVDINECARSSHDCHESATCFNTVGSFTCACNLGYTGNGKVCSGACLDIYTVFLLL